MQVRADKALDNAHPEPCTLYRIETSRHANSVVGDLEQGQAVGVLSPDSDFSAGATVEAMIDRVGDQFVDQERQDGRLLRRDGDFARDDLEVDRQSRWDERPVRLVRDVPRDDVDGGSPEATLIAQEIMDSGNRLDPADGFPEVDGPRCIVRLPQVNREQSATVWRLFLTRWCISCSRAEAVSRPWRAFRYNRAFSIASVAASENA